MALRWCKSRCTPGLLAPRTPTSPRSLTRPVRRSSRASWPSPRKVCGYRTGQGHIPLVAPPHPIIPFGKGIFVSAAGAASYALRATYDPGLGCEARDPGRGVRGRPPEKHSPTRRTCPHPTLALAPRPQPSSDVAFLTLGSLRNPTPGGPAGREGGAGADFRHTSHRMAFVK